MSNIFNYDAPEAARIYDRERYPMGADTLAELLSAYCGTPLKDIHILDAGCGTGQYTEALIRRGIGKITLLDVSSEMLTVAKEKLADAIKKNIVDEAVEAKLPNLPFEEGTFDAVMFNLVLHHLDKNGEKGFPVLQKTLLGTKRCLRQNGILLVTAIQPTTVRNAVWFTQLHRDFAEKVASVSLSSEQYLALFAKCGFQCVLAMNVLRIDSKTSFTNYFDHEGPLKEAWRKGTSMFELVDNQLLKSIESKVTELKEKGLLKQFVEDHDRTSVTGLLTVFVCVSK